MLQEGDVLDDVEDDSKGESDFVTEDEVISDSECHVSEHDELEKPALSKTAKVWWMAWKSQEMMVAGGNV